MKNILYIPILILFLTSSCAFAKLLQKQNLDNNELRIMLEKARLVQATKKEEEAVFYANKVKYLIGDTEVIEPNILNNIDTLLKRASSLCANCEAVIIAKAIYQWKINKDLVAAETLFKKAEKIAHENFEKYSEMPQTLGEYAVFKLWGMKDRSGAREKFDEAFGFNTIHRGMTPPLMLLYASLLLENKQIEKAESVYAKALEKWNTDPFVYVKYANFLRFYKETEDDKADLLFERALHLGYSNYDEIILYAYKTVQDKKLGVAERLYKRAVQLADHAEKKGKLLDITALDAYAKFLYWVRDEVVESDEIGQRILQHYQNKITATSEIPNFIPSYLNFMCTRDKQPDCDTSKEIWNGLTEQHPNNKKLQLQYHSFQKVLVVRVEKDQAGKQRKNQKPLVEKVQLDPATWIETAGLKKDGVVSKSASLYAQPDKGARVNKWSPHLIFYCEGKQLIAKLVHSTHWLIEKTDVKLRFDNQPRMIFKGVQVIKDPFKRFSQIKFDDFADSKQVVQHLFDYKTLQLRANGITLIFNLDKMKDNTAEVLVSCHALH